MELKKLKKKKHQGIDFIGVLFYNQNNAMKMLDRMQIGMLNLST